MKITRTNFYGDTFTYSSLVRATTYRDAWQSAVDCRAPLRLRAKLRRQMRYWALDAVAETRRCMEKRAARYPAFAA